MSPEDMVNSRKNNKSLSLKYDKSNVTEAFFADNSIYYMIVRLSLLRKTILIPEYWRLCVFVCSYILHTPVNTSFTIITDLYR